MKRGQSLRIKLAREMHNHCCIGRGVLEQDKREQLDRFRRREAASVQCASHDLRDTTTADWRRGTLAKRGEPRLRPGPDRTRSPLRAGARPRPVRQHPCPELKAWFDGLRSGKGSCCSDADDSALSDTDWDAPWSG